MQEPIYDQESGQQIAYIDEGLIFNLRQQHVANMRAGNIYNFDGELLGHLEGLHVTSKRDATMPTSFKKLLS